MEDLTPLCEIAYKYGTDKCPQLKHFYTPFYYELLKDRRETIKKVLEMGIGYWKTMKYEDQIYDKRLKRYYQKAPSLRMWRDFFPNAQVYGADCEQDAMYEGERIKTFVCDERKEKHLRWLIKQTGSDIDLFIDDGCHKTNYQINLARMILPMLKKDVIYIIEDVFHPDVVLAGLAGYECELPPLPRERWKEKLIIVKNK